MKCTKCNNELEANAKFCGKCGQNVVAETKTTAEQKSGKKITVTSVASLIVFIFVVSVSRYLTQSTLSPSTNSGTQSISELVAETVKQVRSNTTFPSKLDAATTWVDVTAEPDAIRYHYILSGIDTNSLSDDYLKNYLRSNICQNKDTKNLLDRGINMEYSYLVENETQNYFVSLTKTDCL